MEITPAPTVERPTPVPSAAPQIFTAELTRRDIILAIAGIGEGTDEQYRGRLAGLKLDGLDLSGLNLSYLDIAGTSFRGCNLRKTRFNAVWAADADFTDADARGAEFGSPVTNEQTYILKAKFTRARLSGASFQGVQGDDVDFTDAVLDHAKFNEAELVDSIFDGANVHGANFDRATLRRGALDRANGQAKLDRVAWWPLETEEPVPAGPPLEVTEGDTDLPAPSRRDRGETVGIDIEFEVPVGWRDDGRTHTTFYTLVDAAIEKFATLPLREQRRLIENNDKWSADDCIRLAKDWRGVR